MSNFLRSCLKFTALLTALCIANAAAATSIVIRLPSEGAGGGTLAVQLTYPASPSLYRYSTGAPVVVISPGGHGPGALDPGMPLIAHGFVTVTFLYPGGRGGPFTSDGTYDYRGGNCILALRDVLLFAIGQARDSQNRLITDVILAPVLIDNVGIAALSNGGPTATATLALWSAQLTGIKYVLFMESPSNAQTVNGDLGVNGYDCDPELDGDGNGLPGDDGKNLRYTAYGPSSCQIDYSALAYDAAAPRHYVDPAAVYPAVDAPGVILLDGNGDGILNATGSPACYDTDGNGMIDLDEDYPFTGKITFTESGSLKLFLSPELVLAADAGEIFPDEWPAHIAWPEETIEFWQTRDATLHFAGLASGLPSLAGMLLLRETDHVQSAEDHPHVQQYYDGFTTGGLWRRLNPDYAYVEAFYGGAPPAGTVDNPANAAVAPGTLRSYAEPDTVNSTIPGLCEMADRVRFQRWENNLDGVLHEGSPTPTQQPATPTPTVTPQFTPGGTATPGSTATPAASTTPAPTDTANPSPTPTSTPAPSGTASPATPTVTPTPPTARTNSPTPTASPSPTDTAALTPTPSATPTGEPWLGVRLQMPRQFYMPGDLCSLTATLGYPGQHPLKAQPLFVLLDLGTAEYWFWPSWIKWPDQIDYREVDLLPGESQLTVIDQFPWPDSAGFFSGAKFYSAVLDPAMTAVQGELGVWEFGFGE